MKFNGHINAESAWFLCISGISVGYQVFWFRIQYVFIWFLMFFFFLIYFEHEINMQTIGYVINLKIFNA